MCLIELPCLPKATCLVKWSLSIRSIRLVTSNIFNHGSIKYIAGHGWALCKMLTDFAKNGKELSSLIEHIGLHSLIKSYTDSPGHWQIYVL